jgi:hypothetical protein
MRGSPRPEQVPSRGRLTLDAGQKAAANCSS